MEPGAEDLSCGVVIHAVEPSAQHRIPNLAAAPGLMPGAPDAAAGTAEPIKAAAAGRSTRVGICEKSSSGSYLRSPRRRQRTPTRIYLAAGFASIESLSALRTSSMFTW
jgi:hypothetical protein